MRRRTALTVVSAAIGGAVVPLSFTPTPADNDERRGPQSPTARWDFDERTGTVTREAVSGSADTVSYVFADARYKPGSDPCYWIGTFDKDACRFVPDHEKPRAFDFDEHFTGPSGFATPDGRSVLFSTTQDRRSCPRLRA
ncbi:hypothetical protein [Streptomyces sp. ME19-01-6]|uniref:hypothetical protein n=1 Tax=Streptomyces sp. ME19-01-6 TaxID=3028686 RepID=UPI0029B639AC|nr:hypothetical protein [Streptomyces sp. ME19-01-6]MDX3224604.1 hypothetical protein [Streptomyces sp. ME19-01-6]